jgi:hypothetical protein
MKMRADMCHQNTVILAMTNIVISTKLVIPENMPIFCPSIYIK